MNKVFGIVLGETGFEHGPVQLECTSGSKADNTVLFYNLPGTSFPTSVFLAAMRDLFSAAQQGNSCRFSSSRTILPEMGNNLGSLNLALLLSAVSSKGLLSFIPERLFVTGDFYLDQSGVLCVRAVSGCREKYDAVLRGSKRDGYPEGWESSALFVYVSDREIIDPADAPLKTLRLNTGTSVLSCVSLISEHAVFSLGHTVSFQNLILRTLEGLATSADRERARIDCFLTGDSASGAFFFEGLFGCLRKWADSGARFTFTVYLARPHRGADIIRDTKQDTDEPQWFCGWEGTRESRNSRNANLVDLFLRAEYELKMLRHGYLLGHPKEPLRAQFELKWWEPSRVRLDGRNCAGNAILLESGPRLQSFHSEHDLFHAQTDMSKGEFDAMRKLYLPNEDGHACPLVRQAAPDYGNRWVIIGPPGVGKNAVTDAIAKKRGKKVFDSDIYIDNYNWNDSHIAALARENPLSARYSRKEFRELFGAYPEAREYRRDSEFAIRTKIVEICLKMALATGDLLCLGGKEILDEDTYFLLKSNGFSIVYLAPPGDAADSYAALFFRDGEPNWDLLDERKRENIYKLYVQEAGGDRAIFSKLLIEKIWNPRIDLYRARSDITIERIPGEGAEDTAERLLEMLGRGENDR